MTIPGNFSTDPTNNAICHALVKACPLSISGPIQIIIIQMTFRMIFRMTSKLPIRMEFILIQELDIEIHTS